MLNIIILIGVGLIVYLGLSLFSKMKSLQELQAVVENLRKTLSETDEQAKLIVRTDMELNKIQEELDKRIISLFALQKLSRSISTSLEENQIFKKIELADLQELGFEKAASFLWDESSKKFSCCLCIGYPEEQTPFIETSLDVGQELYLNFMKSDKPVSSSSGSKLAELRENIKYKFKADSFVACPVLPKEGSKGFIVLASSNPESVISEGDEELVTILANQLGQALENARLFEKTWGAQQELEKKVEERTRELSKALEEVKIINKRKSDFVSSVSHELRTPLTSIKGYASILLAGKLGEVPEEIKTRLTKINKHSDELVQFVNDLLDLSRLESGKVVMKQSSEDIKKICEEVVDLLGPQLKEKQISTSIDIPEASSVAFVDASQIKRVFINLVNNAIKFTPERGKISIKASKSDGNIQVDVTDTGCGIAEADLNAVFDEFYRVDNAINQQLKGSGLGLTLVRNIIEAHKGRVWVKSSPGKGSTFSFTLPI